MDKQALLLIFCLTLLSTTALSDEPSSLFKNPPDGWRTEVITFPLEFAPDIELTGIEELLFSPGMFDADSETYFTYAFIWWIDGNNKFPDKIMQQHLLSYFRGLYQAVSKQQQETSQFSVSLEGVLKPIDPPADAAFYYGQVDWIDPFVTEEKLLLNFTAQHRFCPKHNRTLVLFELTPQPKNHSNWQTLTPLSAGPDQCY